MEELLKEWQNRLNLNDWTIKLSANVHNMPDGECCGHTDWNETVKAAHIYLLHPDEYGDRVVPYDQEKTLVHELLHIKFTFLHNQTEEDLQGRILHQLIDEIACALVDAKRSGTK